MLGNFYKYLLFQCRQAVSEKILISSLVAKIIQSCARENFTGLKKEFGAKTRTRACRMGMNNVETFDLRLQRTLLHPMKDQV